MKKLSILMFLTGSLFLAGANAWADEILIDDSIIVGKVCVGLSCVLNEPFGGETVKLNDTNPAIRAEDTSVGISSSNDWQITFNPGATNQFSIEDITGGTTPFTLEAGAPNNSLFVDDSGKVGMGTSTPIAKLHLLASAGGPTPRMMFENPDVTDTANQKWFFDIKDNTGDFRISRLGSGVQEMNLTPSGDLKIPGKFISGSSFGGGAPQFVLKDGYGAQRGTVITVNDDSTSFVENNDLQVTNRSVLTALDVQKADTTTVTVGLSVDWLNIRFQHRLVFENLGCQGPPRIRDIVAYSDFPPAITLSAVVGMPGQPDVRKLYVQTDEAEIPQPKNIQSVLVGDICISPVSILSMPTVSAEMIDVELHITHPWPYTLEGSAGVGGSGIHQVQLEDTNNLDCAATGGGPGGTPGWCPDGIQTTFFIVDPLVTEKSVVMVTGVNIPGIAGSSCDVFLINPTVPGFRINCGLASDGSVLNYAIIP